MSVNIDPDALARGINPINPDRRHNTSIQNLLSHLHLIDHLIVIDNSHIEGVIILSTTNGSITYRSDSLPQWSESIVHRLQPL
nr:hypothetical protein [Paenibacillus pinihumi]